MQIDKGFQMFKNYICSPLLLSSFLVAFAIEAKNYEVIGDYLISKEETQSVSSISDYCSSFNLPKLIFPDASTLRVINWVLGKAKSEGLTTATKGKLYTLNNGRVRRGGDLKHTEYNYPVCIGASNYPSLSLPVNMAKISTNYDGFELMGIDLNGSLLTEFKVKAPKEKYLNQLNFFDFLSSKLVSTHHLEVFSDKQKINGLQQYYKSIFKGKKYDYSKSKIPSNIGSTASVEVDLESIAELMKLDKPVNLNSLEQSLFDTFKGQLIYVTLTYEMSTGKIIEIDTDQRTKIVKQKLPSIAKKLSEKWNRPYKLYKKEYSFDLSRFWQCNLGEGKKRTVNGTFWTAVADKRNNNDPVVRIQCKVKSPHEYMYQVEPKFKANVDKILKNPPSAKELDKEVFL